MALILKMSQLLSQKTDKDYEILFKIFIIYQNTYKKRMKL